MYQMPLFDLDPLIKLGEVEVILAKVFRPVPTRPTIVEWIEEGILTGKQIGLGNNWYVYASSLDKLILSTQEPRQLKLAA